MNAADEQALRDYYHSPLKRYWHSFHPWVESLRHEFQDPELFSEMGNLVERWK